MPAPIAGGSDGEPMAAIVRTRADRTRVSWLTGGGLQECTVGQLGGLLKREDGFVWVDIPTLDRPAERLLADVFKFHPLAIRDCREPGHVPKVHVYDDHLFVVLHAPEWGEEGQIRHRELNQFIGPRFLVTVHERRGPQGDTPPRLETNSVLDRIKTGRMQPTNPAELSYSIVTRLSVWMERMVSDLARSVAVLEQAVSSHERHLLRRPEGSSESMIDEMFQLRHALLAIETIADQNRVVYARTAVMARRLLPTEQRRFIDDAEDQFTQVRRLCRGQKELLQGVLDFSRTADQRQDGPRDVAAGAPKRHRPADQRHLLDLRDAALGLHEHAARHPGGGAGPDGRADVRDAALGERPGLVVAPGIVHARRSRRSAAAFSTAAATVR